MKIEISEKVVEFAGIPIHKVTMNDVIDYCDTAIRKRCSLMIGMINVAKLVNMQNDFKLKKGVLDADLIAADGQGIVLLSYMVGSKLPERVTGIDIMFNLLSLANERSYSVYFLGANEKVVLEVIEKTKEKYPGVNIAGYSNGYFDIKNEGERIARKIKESAADILLVAMSSPKKEIFIDKWKDFMDVSVCHGVGGSFDVFAGKVKRAPGWMQRSGLEWFFRVLQEPKRMWKRYLITNLKFFVIIVKEIINYRIVKKVQ
jgi:N-acetylglucosaminyldiphosphoundecaprenol N-acetyl-beta-D-mannosaminyltransferase